MRFDDQHPVVGAHDATGLGEHELDQARILLELGRQRQRAGTGLDRRQRLHPSLRFRNDLLRQADDVVICDLDRGCGGGGGDERSDRVAGADLADAGNGNDLEPAAQVRLTEGPSRANAAAVAGARSGR